MIPYARIRRRFLIRCAVVPFLFLIAGRTFAQAPATPEPPAAPQPPADSTATSTEAAAPTEVVKMEEFDVTTKIDTYHMATSDMATKIPMDLKELSSSLSILNQTAIQDRDAVTLTDVTNYVTGATASQASANGFSFRGFANTGSYTQNIQIDGLQGTTLKKGGTTTANVDSIEFLKGPNIVLYGQMNPGGLMNVVTKSPMETEQTDFRFTVGTFAGQFDAPGAKQTTTVTLDNTGPVGNSTHLFYRMILDEDSSPTSRPGNYDHDFAIFPSLTYKFSPDTSFTIKIEDNRDFRHQDDGLVPIFTHGTAYGPTATYFVAPYNTMYNDNEDKATDQGEALSTFFHTLLPGGWTFRMQTRSVYHQDVVRELTVNNANVYSPTAKNASPTSLFRRQYNYVKNGHRYDYGDMNIFRTFDFGLVKDTVLLGAGGGGEFFGNARLAFGPNQLLNQAIHITDPILDQVVYPADGTGATNQLTYQTAAGEYLSNQFKVGDKLHLSAGVRHDLQKVHGENTLQPGLTLFDNKLSAYTRQVGVLYDATPEISPYVSWSQSLKPQTTIAFDATGNSAFPPESGQQWEGGLKFETPDRNFNATVAVYEINRTNVVVASGTNFTVATGNAQVGQAISRLDGEQQSKGLELETQWQPMPNWQLQGGIAFDRPIIADSITNPQTVGLDIANAPRRSGNFWTRYNIPVGELKGVGFGVGTIYNGESWAGDPTTTVYYRLSGYVRWDSSIYYSWKRINFSLNCQNVFDKRYISGAQSANTLNVGEQRKLIFSLDRRF